VPHETDDIRERLIRMEAQINRLVSDAESEKNVRRDRNKDIDKRLSEIEKWIAKWGGAFVALGIVATLLSIIGFVIKIKTAP
jgi:flagellar motor component MotA